MQSSFETATLEGQEMGEEVVQLATKDSIRALDEKSREAIERLTVETAQDVARFLYERDRDIQQAALFEPSEADYRNFLTSRFSPIIEHDPLVMDKEGERWEMQQNLHAPSEIVRSRNKDNAKDFHSSPPELTGKPVDRPLYLEMTFIDLAGREKIKVTTSDFLAPDLQDVSLKKNTFCKAETYFEQLQDLQPGEIFVSDVIGAYQKTDLIGIYSKTRAEKAGIDFDPQNSAYAGKENPVGKRFQGLVRWATPVERNGQVIGFVTLALDHTHIMDFTDHLVPTEKRYSAISDAGSGNYAFMWDYLSRNISHPRDYFITGYNPESGEPAIPWLEAKHYQQWQEGSLTISDFLNTLPLYEDQSLDKKAAPEQTSSGYVGLDCRYLNFAPQCDGWVNLTQHGGSGSFLIFWSGLWKLTTAAAIPYYTGQYAKSARGFGFVTIGANVHEFHKAAIGTAKQIEKIGADHITILDQQFQRNREFLKASLKETTKNLTVSTMAMIFVIIIIAIWMASTLTGRITQIIKGISRFQQGNMDQRLQIHSGDELEDLALTFNSMADNIQQAMTDIRVAHKQSEKANQLFLEEISIRKKAEKELARHRDTLEQMVSERTSELELEILERKQAEQSKHEMEIRLNRAEKMEAIGTLAGGVAHDLNNILSGIATYPELLLLQLEEKDPMYGPLQTIKSSGYKAAAIVQDLLTLARRGVLITKILNLNSIITDYLSSHEHQELLLHHPNVRVETHLAKNLMDLMGSEVHLSKTLMNLVSNGIESMTGDGQLTIQTENRYLDKPLKLYDQILEGEYVTLLISDTGSGIREEDQNRIFEPFYTNKKMGRSGTGLGMAVVWGTVQDHKGYIDCQSQVNQGTVFTLYFPVCRGAVANDVFDPEFKELTGNGETILLVDDIQEQLEIASMILTKLKYTVYTVSSGEKALSFLEENVVDLVILDMIMEPGIDGLETYQAIINRWPQQKAIIASGFSETERLNEALQLGVKSYLKKPYSVNKLGQHVKKGLSDT
ncbi:MAG: response regulator [Proteobacteria bacterium]|nr:response regulator [Pseudomonadota bacterium]MBU1454818.1 response regulator [Pseudomonadota bacterium]